MQDLSPPSPQRISAIKYATQLHRAKVEIREYLSSLEGMIFDYNTDKRESDLLKDLETKNYDAQHIRDKLTAWMIEIDNVEEWKERYVLIRSFFRVVAHHKVCKMVCDHDDEMSEFVYSKIQSMEEASPKQRVLYDNNLDLFDKLANFYSPSDRLTNQ